MKFFDIKKVIFLVISLLLFVFVLCLEGLNLEFIVGFLNYLFPIITFWVVAIWIFLIVKYKTKKRWLRVITNAIFTLVFLVMIPYIMLFNSWSGKKYYEETSPSGKNTIIVFEGGFIDASYTAYPKIMGIFYQYQNNGHVSKHDFWGGRGVKIEVDWKSDDLAHVKVIIDGYKPNKGSNPNDEIIVNFK